MEDEHRGSGALSERAWLAAYDPRAFDPVAVTCDVVALTLRGGALHVLLVRRGGPPFAGSWALPGGFIRPGRETLDGAAARELAEETGLGPGPGLSRVHLEQLGSYGDPDRDPRMHIVTVAYLAFAPGLPDPRAGSDAAAAAWVPVAALGLGGPARPLQEQDRRDGIHGGGPARRSPETSAPEEPPGVGPGTQTDAGTTAGTVTDKGPDRSAERDPGTDPEAGPGAGTPGAFTRRPVPLAFDHARILADGLDRARSKIEYTPLATAFLGEEFTVSELRSVYESVWGTRLHAGNFHRKVLSVPGFVESTGATAERGGTRGGPRARLYRAGDARLLHPALLRPDREEDVR